MDARVFRGRNRSVHRCDFARVPGLVEPGFKRAVEPQDHEPAFTRQRLDPVVLVALSGLGAKETIDVVLFWLATLGAFWSVWIIERV